MSFASFENIVVAVDMSDYSDLVFKQGLELSKALGKPMSCVYVLAKTAQKPPQSESERETYVRRHTERVRKKYGVSENITVHIRFGEPEVKILEVASLYQHPLLVAGHRGGHPWADFFLGSVAKKLALSKIPVWIHRGDRVVRPSKFLVPCDVEDRSFPLIQATQLLMREFKAQAEIFHVMRIPTGNSEPNAYELIYESFKEIDDEEVAEFKLKFPDLKVLRAEGDISFEIVEKSKDYDLMILGPSYRGAEKPFFGTLTTHLIGTGETPILVLPGLVRRKPTHLDLF